MTIPFMFRLEKTHQAELDVVMLCVVAQGHMSVTTLLVKLTPQINHYVLGPPYSGCPGRCVDDKLCGKYTCAIIK